MIRKGMLKSFDSSAYTASVRIIGSVSVWLDSVKVSEALAAVDMVAGRSVAVLFLDPSNPDEAIVIGLWGVASLSISDTAYNATSWNGVTNVAASKNAIRDKLEAGVTPSAHKASHQDTGTDEISVTGLAGLLADDQHVLDTEVLAVAAALSHGTEHQNGEADEISVAALSGLLADDQHVLDAEVKAAAVSDTAYDATSWDGVTDVAPSKNAVRDKIETISDSTIECVASDVLSASADTQRTSASESYVKVKEISTLRAGTYRVKFDLKIPEEINVYGRIYKNGVAFGTERISTSPTYETFSEDLTFAANDLIQLYYKTGTSVAPVYTQNFRLYCHMAPDTTVALN